MYTPVIYGPQITAESIKNVSGHRFCTEASFTILQSINHMLERGSKVFGCFLDVRKAFDTVWIDGLLFKLFSEFGIKDARGWS